MPVAGTAALPVREKQVRAWMALRELAADRLGVGPDTASRRDTGVVLLPARPTVYASGAVRVIEPCRVHAAPPVAWIMRPLPIHLPFDRAQERSVPGLAFGQQRAHVRPVVPGSVAPSPNVNAHKASPVMTLPSAVSTSVRVASRDDRTRSRLPVPVPGSWPPAPAPGSRLPAPGSRPHGRPAVFG